MRNIKTALDDSIHFNNAMIKTPKAKAIFYYGAICALAFSGQIKEAKTLAIQLGVNITNVIGNTYPVE